jgi:hypothetical protein
MPEGNQGTFELTLLGVDGTPAKDPSTFISFIRSGDGTEIDRNTKTFPPSRRFLLPAFPQERAIVCSITPQRYRSREVGVFTLTDGETIRRQPTVFRRPEKWSAKFDKWANLPASLKPLQDCLTNSPELRTKDGKNLGRFTDTAYENIDPGDRPTINAKACMLNLFAKLNTLNEPVFGRKPWFGFVERLLVIGRERFIAIVDDEMLARIRQIHQNIGNFEFYKRTPVGDHNKNIPSWLSFKKNEMVSIKTREDHGNLQLTMTPAKAADGATVTILDADIDENGKLMAHLGDLFKHKFSGGTHPFDIHEFLVLEDHARPLGYDLV